MRGRLAVLMIAKLGGSDGASRSPQNREHGRIHLGQGHDDQLRMLVGDWWQAREELDGDEQAVMLAYRRRDVAELNGRARAYMRASSELGGAELEAGERGFSAGDRVVCTRNDRRLGVLNGDRGTVAAVDEESRSLQIRLDSGRQARLGPGYLERGGLDHDYALTVHRSQGMSVERTFVLGSEDLYRELGYTALSRHRQSCRFYINAGEPPQGKCLPGLDGERDPLDQVVRALGQRRAKELALDRHELDEELLATPTHELADSSAQLDELLSSYPSLARRATTLAQKEEVSADLARNATERLDASRRERDTLGPLARKARSRLDQRIERQAAAQSQRQADLAQVRDERLHADAAGEQWLEENGATLAELCAAEHELTSRREAEYERALQAARIDPCEHLRDHLGDRPDDLSGRESWDNAADALLQYERRFGELPGPNEPAARGIARAWRSLQGALHATGQPAQPSVDRTAELDRGDDLNLGP